MENFFDATIIGSGPAGISAAIYLKRAGFNVLVLGKKSGSLFKAKLIENYYGFYGSGEELFIHGLNNAAALGIKIKEEEATEIVPGIDGNDNGFSVTAGSNEYFSKCLILALGIERESSSIKGISEYEGSGVSRCAVCDGFFFKGKRVCILGSGQFALHEAEYLSNICSEAVILTDGEAPIDTIPDSIPVITKSISRLTGENGIFNGVEYADGSSDSFSGMFIALGTAGSDAFSRKLGLSSENGIIPVDSNMQTEIPGLYAVGDCTGAPYQVAKAVYQGMTAANHIISSLER